MKPLKVLLLVIPGAAILFVLAIATILFTPFLDEINKIDIRINLKERVKQITKIDMPKNAKVIEIKSASNFFGEGYSSIVLGLTSQETQALIEKIKNHPDWKWEFSSECLSTAEKQSLNPEQLRDLYGQDNSYRLNKLEAGFNRQAVLCPKQNILLVGEDNY
ncbi:hypothetical protein ACE1CI_11670 [Aerosakkonemataceae cyanobacterium BLCC-F50]|uniref:Uncharacterized protein n=1 Tax=Floridaenema flaviceps BLCC-F50 TaxID=3153642 RepID=A0ABV4XPA9_9CYAN